MVNPDIRFVDESFEDTGDAVIEDFLLRYTQFFSKTEREEILLLEKTESRLKRILLQSAIIKPILPFESVTFRKSNNTLLSLIRRAISSSMPNARPGRVYLMNLLISFIWIFL